MDNMDTVQISDEYIGMRGIKIKTTYLKLLPLKDRFRREFEARNFDPMSNNLGLGIVTGEGDLGLGVIHIAPGQLGVRPYLPYKVKGVGTLFYPTKYVCWKILIPYLQEELEKQNLEWKDVLLGKGVPVDKLKELKEAPIEVEEG